MVTPVVMVFLQGLSRLAAAEMELPGVLAGNRCAEDCVYVVSDRFSAYNHLPLEQCQLCWAHLIRDLTAIADRQGASGEIGMELGGAAAAAVSQWHQWKEGLLAWPELQHRCHPIRRTLEATLRRAVDLGCERGERMLWAQGPDRTAALSGAIRNALARLHVPPREWIPPFHQAMLRSLAILDESPSPFMLVRVGRTARDRDQIRHHPSAAILGPHPSVNGPNWR